MNFCRDSDRVTNPTTIVEPPSVPASTSWRVLAAAGFTVVAWASAFVVIRFVGRDYSPGALSLGRLVVGSLALSLIIGYEGRWVASSGRDCLLLTVMGVTCYSVYMIALSDGELQVEAGTAAMSIQHAPILIGVFAGILMGEGFPRMLVIG